MQPRQSRLARIAGVFERRGPKARDQRETTMRIFRTIMALVFGHGFLSACDQMMHAPMAAEGATIEGEMAHDNMAAEPAM